MSTLAASERAALCDLLLELGPDAPTLCEGWDASRLAAHLWARERDPLSVPGAIVPALGELTERRLDRALARRGFEGLVEDLRAPAARSPFAIPSVDAAANAVEYFVHREDLRRGADPAGTAPLRRTPAEEDELWAKLGSMGGMLMRRSPVVVIAERSDAPEGAARRRLAGPRRGPSVIVRGLPSELVLFAFGRRSAADVEVTGPVDAVSAFLDESYGL